MSDTIFLKVMDNGGYFALIIGIGFMFYKLGKIFITGYLQLEAERNKTQLELEKQKSEGLVNSLASISEQNINNTKEIVSGLNTHIVNNKNEHSSIIKKLDETHTDVKFIKDKMK